MKGHRGSGSAHRRHRGPDLPDRPQDREMFRQNIAFPSSSEEEFARRHAELYGEEEHLVDGHHVGSPHFPRRSERARTHGAYTTSNHQRDITRDAYRDEFDAATAEYEGFNHEQDLYYQHTSDGMLPRHHTALLPLARAREEPNFHNASTRERLLTGGYEWHSLDDQELHWRRADAAYQEHQQVQADHARHRRYRSDPWDHDSRDCYDNSPVHRTIPHTRSRNSGLPPPGTYCDRLRTPPEENDRYVEEGYDRR